MYGDFNFSEVSENRLEGCHPDLRVIMNKALEMSMVDFGIAVGKRSIEKQQELYASGREKEGPILTYIDGVTKKSKHNAEPVSLAADIYAWVNGQVTWQERYYIYLGGVITTVAARLHKEGKITKRVRWGGNFDQDHDILDKGSFVDLPHFELV